VDEAVKVKPAAHDACFPAGLRFNKLLKLQQTECKISSNLLKRKQSSRKTIVCRWLYCLLLFTLKII